MQSKKLARAFKKSAVFLITLSLSAFMLCGCGDDSVATDTEANTTTQESTTEQTELENQDKDPTEATTQATTQQTTQGTTQSTQETTTAPTTQTPTTEATNPGHVHTWTTETYYTTETQVVHHDAVTHTVHHDAVTHQEQVTTYTTETQTVHHGATWSCNCCGATFNSEAEAQAHMSNSVACYTAGYDYCGAWDETVEVQVPHTRTVCSECGAVQ